MKYLLLSLLLASSIFAIKPQSKHDCFLAYTKFHALIQSCTHQYIRSGGGGHGYGYGITAISNPDEQAKCIEHYYNEFVKECREEANPRA